MTMACGILVAHDRRGAADHNAVGMMIGGPEHLQPFLFPVMSKSLELME